MLLDRVARTFPKMQMILAHLGMPWHSEAAEMPRFHPNMVVDLTGSMGGWRAHTPPEKFKEWFWWPRAFESIVFGTDVYLEEVETVYKRDRELCRQLGLEKTVEEKIFGGTVARILRLDGK
jgi:predicted TIM-barrel fold metal-dependent hydrolase